MKLLQVYLDAHDGVVAASAAQSKLGLTHRELRRLVERGVLVRLCRGGYADAARFGKANGAAAHKLRVAAVLATAPESFAASHQSAAVLLRLPVLATDLTAVHVTRRRGAAHGRRVDAYVVHEFRGESFVRVGRWYAVDPASAVLGAVAQMSDVGAQGLVDAALHHAVVSAAELESALARREGFPGVGRVRLIVGRADPAAESVGESGLRVTLVALGYQVEAQVEFHDALGLIGRVDFWLPELGVIVEFDGAVKYEGADGRDALVREKRREDRLRALGHGVVRITWAMLFRPDDVRDAIDFAAGRRRHRPPERRSA